LNLVVIFHLQERDHYQHCILVYDQTNDENEAKMNSSSWYHDVDRVWIKRNKYNGELNISLSTNPFHFIYIFLQKKYIMTTCLIYFTFCKTINKIKMRMLIKKYLI